jgi:hypothetical protein
VFSVGAAPRIQNEDLRQLRERITEFRSWQLADDGGVKRVQLSVESPAVKRSDYMGCSTVMFGVCDSMRLLQLLC